MKAECGRVDHVERLFRIASGISDETPLTELEVARLLPMRELLRDLLKSTESALLGRARSTIDARTQDACITQQRRLRAIYDPTTPPEWV